MARRAHTRSSARSPPPSPARREAQQAVFEILAQLTPGKLRTALACDSPSSRQLVSTLRKHIAIVNDALPAGRRSARTARPDRSLALVDSRVDTIEAAALDLPVSIDEYTQLLLTGEAHLTAEERETAAFCRLVRGYAGDRFTALQTWFQHFLKIFTLPKGGLIAVVNSFNHDSRDPLLWATNRHKALAVHDAATKTTAFAHHVVQSVAAIEFSLVWEEQGKQWKTNTFAKLFQAEHGDDVNDGEFEAWKRKVGKTITARNKLAELYDKFGPHVLLDPQWSAHALHPSHRSETYPAVADALFLEMPKKDDAPTARSGYAVNHEVMLGVLSAIDNALAEWVYEFIRAHPSEPALPTVDL